MIDSFIDLLIWLVDWLIDWFWIDSMIHWFNHWLIDWFILIEWLTDSLIHWLIKVRSTSIWSVLPPPIFLFMNDGPDFQHKVRPSLVRYLLLHPRPHPLHCFPPLPPLVLGTYPKAFSLEWLPKWQFPNWPLPKCAISLAAASQKLGLALWGAAGCYGGPSTAASADLGNCTFGKLPLGK